ncbi:unnamed protein product [Dovyalis caffra]|uniref:Uncharacterized protein n=1 Tax=Dovyalis caffra TaxID=77055 RepID=A0AAV1QQP9_9ROSI|nr:unnamed protein product [Dovyalis caffra]
MDVMIMVMVVVEKASMGDDGGEKKNSYSGVSIGEVRAMKERDNAIASFGDNFAMTGSKLDDWVMVTIRWFGGSYVFGPENGSWLVSFRAAMRMLVDVFGWRALNKRRCLPGNGNALTRQIKEAKTKLRCDLLRKEEGLHIVIAETSINSLAHGCGTGGPRTLSTQLKLILMCAN